ncbi:MAG: hypothetical protein IPN92_10485 [Chromatiaceae bacterium]|nr:hypothetical protein [Chromatiaceae bacterium]
MSIPFYEDLFLPVLQIIYATDKQIVTITKLVDKIASHSHLFVKDNTELSLYQQKCKLKETLGIAEYYLFKAGLLYYSEDWKMGLTETALQILKNPPLKIDHEFLFQFQENKVWGLAFLKFKNFVDSLPETITSKVFEEIHESHFREISVLKLGEPKDKKQIRGFDVDSRYLLGFILTSRNKRIYDEPFIQSFYPYGMKRLTAIEHEIAEKQKLENET